MNQGQRFSPVFRRKRVTMKGTKLSDSDRFKGGVQELENAAIDERALRRIGHVTKVTCRTARLHQGSRCPVKVKVFWLRVSREVRDALDPAQLVLIKERGVGKPHQAVAPLHPEDGKK